MSRAFIAEVIRSSTDLPAVAARSTANDLVYALTKELKKSGKFTLPGFGTLTVRKTKARKALNPKTGEPVRVRAGKTVKFKASPVLRKSV